MRSRLVGVIVILEAVGIDLSAFAVLAGAVGVGLGFGLQNVTSNFVSGLIILIERPIKVGDRDRDRQHQRRGPPDRSPRHDGRDRGEHRRSSFPTPSSSPSASPTGATPVSSRPFVVRVRVSWNTDAELVRRLLLEVAAEHPHVLPRAGAGGRAARPPQRARTSSLQVWSTQYLQGEATAQERAQFRDSREARSARPRSAGARRSRVGAPDLARATLNRVIDRR